MASILSLMRTVFGRGQTQAAHEAVEQDSSTTVDTTNATAPSELSEILEESVEPDLSPPKMIARTDRGRFVMEKAYTHLDPNRPVSSQEGNGSAHSDGSEIDKIEE